MINIKLKKTSLKVLVYENISSKVENMEDETSSISFLKIF
jgi:hypothetical protein